MADEPLTDADIAMHYADVTDETKYMRASIYVSQVRQAAELFHRELVRLRSENAAMRPIVAAVAESPLDTVYAGGQCHYCNALVDAGKSRHNQLADHKLDCPTVLAARVMEGMKE